MSPQDPRKYNLRSETFGAGTLKALPLVCGRYVGVQNYQYHVEDYSR